MNTRLRSIGIALLLLVGCAASAKYDFDWECPRSEFFEDSDRGDTGWLLACGSPDFVIQCDAKSLQMVGTAAGEEKERYCTTFDGKSVRIVLK
ncbi:MAG: hypothetical protein AAB855_01655 [Patescibacteria group bacterium]